MPVICRYSGDGALVVHFLVVVLTYTGGRGYTTCLCQWLKDLIDGEMSEVVGLPFKRRLSILRFE